MIRFGGVKVKTDYAAIKARLERARKAALIVVTNELLKDSAKYVKYDSGELQGSGVMFSKPEKGEVIYRTPYARRQYYTGEPRRAKNPNARMLWIHYADAENRSKYTKMLNKVYSETK